MREKTLLKPTIIKEPSDRVSVSCLFPIILLPLLSLSACYHPDPYEPKEYLIPEVYVKFGNDEWEIDKASFSLNFVTEVIAFGAGHPDESKAISCRIRISQKADTADLFHQLTGNDLGGAIKTGSYRTNDTLIVSFGYSETKDGSRLIGAERSNMNQWDDAVPEFNEFIIEQVSTSDGEVYLSGAFTARVYRTHDNTLTPAYHFYSGTYKDVRVTDVYP